MRIVNYNTFTLRRLKKTKQLGKKLLQCWMADVDNSTEVKQVQRII